MTQQRIETDGKLGSTYGIRGWLRVYSSTEQAESIFDYQPCFLKSQRTMAADGIGKLASS